MSDEEKTYIPETEFLKVYREARIYVFLYLCVIALSIYERSILPLMFVGIAKICLGKDEEAVAWLRRSIETNRSFPLPHFHLAAALAQLGRLSEARSAVAAGLALNPTFTIRRFRKMARSDDPTVRAQGRRLVEGMHKAGVPEE